MSPAGRAHAFDDDAHAFDTAKSSRRPVDSHVNLNGSSQGAVC